VIAYLLLSIVPETLYSIQDNNDERIGGGEPPPHFPTIAGLAPIADSGLIYYITAYYATGILFMDA